MLNGNISHEVVHDFLKVPDYVSNYVKSVMGISLEHFCHSEYTYSAVSTAQTEMTILSLLRQAQDRSERSFAERRVWRIRARDASPSAQHDTWLSLVAERRIPENHLE